MTIIAEMTDDVWTVRDTDGGRWWPSEEAADEIAMADDPEATALRICENEPMRGQWRG